MTITLGSNKYCVPSALSALTGKTTDECVSLMREHLGDQDVRGVFIPLALRVLHDLGYQTRQFDLMSLRITLTSFVKNRVRRRDTQYLISTGGHALVVLGEKIYDNSFPDGTLVSSYPYRRHSLKMIYEVTHV